MLARTFETDEASRIQTVALLVGPDQSQSISNRVQFDLPGLTTIRSSSSGDIAEALTLALRTQPDLLCLMGSAHFQRSIFGVLLSLKDQNMPLPAVMIVDGDRPSFASRALGTHGDAQSVLKAALEGKLHKSKPLRQVCAPLLSISCAGAEPFIGLTLAGGVYSYCFGAEGLELFSAKAQLKAHLFKPKHADVFADEPEAPRKKGQTKIKPVQRRKPDDALWRVKPDKGGALTCYLFGVYMSTLALPLLASKSGNVSRPLVYLACEQAKKARMSALRAFRGKIDRAQSFYGVHLGSCSSVEVKGPGPLTLDGLALSTLMPHFIENQSAIHVSCTAPLKFLGTLDEGQDKKPAPVQAH